MQVRALSEELENPLNVHRWRKLEGSDPVAYDMILKIQILQKRLILKTEQVNCLPAIVPNPFHFHLHFAQNSTYVVKKFQIH